MNCVITWVPDILVVLALVAIAVGRIRPLRINRAGIAFTSATLILLAAYLMAGGGREGQQAMSSLLGEINAPTLLLLVSMMILATNLSLSGFFSLVVRKIHQLRLSPRMLLWWVMLVSGVFSALFINDTAVIMLAPLIIQLCRKLSIDPRPQLLGLAMGSNTGSALTLVGNPQNILIAGISGLSFGRYTLVMVLPVFLSLAVSWTCITLIFRNSLAASCLPTRTDTGNPPRAYRPLMYKSLLSLGGFFIAVLAGMNAALAALLAASVLLVTRRLAPSRVFQGIDWTLPVFFCGLFVITGAARSTHVFQYLETVLLPLFARNELYQAGIISVFSQFISNVPTVMLLSPIMVTVADPELAWTLLAAVSTMAGNLTILGSVANLLVAEAAKSQGMEIGFMDFLKAGFFSSIISIVLTVFWLQLLM